MITENKCLEIKERLPSKDQITKSAAAFANGGGGQILIGVKADGKTVVGIELDKYQELEEQIVNSIFDSIYPPVIPHVSLRYMEEKPILSIEINEGTIPPYYIKREGLEKGIYIRVGSTTKKADSTLVDALKLKARNINYDSTLIYEASSKELNVDICREFVEMRKRVRKIPEQNIDLRFFRHYSLVGKGQEKHKPTVGGLLLFSTKPAIHLPFATIMCARFKGLESHEYIDEVELNGFLVKQIEESIQFVKRHINKKMFFDGNIRTEEYEYPISAIREIIVNAVCHRDYLSHRSNIKISIYDDRIEVVSPGDLLPHLTIDDLGKGISEIRNPVIAKVLRDWGYIEEWGKGISKVIDLCKKRKLPCPKFSEEGLYFKVVISKELTDISEMERLVLNLIPYKNAISAKELEDGLNLHRNSVLNALRNLLEKGVVQRIGSGRNQKYIRI